jgi:RimJ/RimL family protein N-acetyltransferase
LFFAIIVDKSSIGGIIMISIRKAKMEDIKFIMPIIQDAKNSLKRRNIPQWQAAYPESMNFEQDIKDGWLYVCHEDATIVGVAALVFAEDPYYKVIIDGSWQGDSTYAAIHRLALADKSQGRGIATKFVNLLTDQAILSGFHDIRIDTHEKNQSMRALISRCNFTQRGTIFIEDGTPRIAYQILK